MTESKTVRYIGKDCPRKIFSTEVSPSGQTIYAYQNCGTDCPLCCYIPAKTEPRLVQVTPGLGNEKASHEYVLDESHFVIYCGCVPLRIEEVKNHDRI